MRDLVSRWVYGVMLVASLAVVPGAFINGFGWAGMLWLTLAVCVGLVMVLRVAPRSINQVLYDVEAEPALAVSPAPKAVLEIRS